MRSPSFRQFLLQASDRLSFLPNDPIPSPFQHYRRPDEACITLNESASFETSQIDEGKENGGVGFLHCGQESRGRLRRQLRSYVVPNRNRRALRYGHGAEARMPKPEPAKPRQALVASRPLVYVIGYRTIPLCYIS